MKYPITLLLLASILEANVVELVTLRDDGTTVGAQPLYCETTSEGTECYY